MQKSENGGYDAYEDSINNGESTNMLPSKFQNLRFS